jgi:hypothetical protein
LDRRKGESAVSKCTSCNSESTIKVNLDPTKENRF